MKWSLRHFLGLVLGLQAVVVVYFVLNGLMIFPGDHLSWFYPFKNSPEFADTGPFLPNKGYQDPVFFFFPYWEFFTDALASGHFPMWNPLEGAGMPVGALHGLGTLFPLHWVAYALLPPLMAWQVELLLEVLVAAVSSFLLFRRWSGSAHGATIGALGWTLGGWHSAFLQVTCFGWPVALFPMIVLGLDDIQRGKARGPWLTVLGVAGFVLVGHLQMILAAVPLLGGYLIFRKVPGRGPKFLALCGGVLVSMPHLGPLAELTVLSGRASRDLTELLSCMLAPREYLGLLFPQAMGSPSDGFYLGRSLGNLVVDGREHALYAGQVPFLAAVLAGLRRRDRSTRIVLGWTVLGFVLAGSPALYQACTVICPPLLWLTPLRFLPFVLFGVCYLAALGWASLEEKALSLKEKRIFAGLLTFFVGWMMTLSIPATRQDPALSNWLVKLAQKNGISKPPYFEGSFGEVIIVRMMEHLSLTSTAVWFPLLLLLSGAAVLKFGPSKETRFLGIVGLVLLDLVVYFFHMNVPVKSDQFYPPSADIQAMAPGRTMDLEKPVAPTRVLGRGRGLHPNILLNYGVANFESYESVLPGDYRRLFRVINDQHGLAHQVASSTSDRRFTPGLLDLFGVSLTYDHPYDSEGKELDSNLKVDPVRETVLRGYLSNTWRVEKDPLQVFQPDFDPRKEVLLETEPGFASGHGSPYLKLVDPTLYSYDIVTFEVSPEQPCLLVLTDLHYPGWKATVNGEPVEILKAYGFVRALELAPGPSKVVMTFRPRGFWLWIGCMFLGLLVMAIMSRRYQRRNSQAGKPTGS